MKFAPGEEVVVFDDIRENERCVISSLEVFKFNNKRIYSVKFKDSHQCTYYEENLRKLTKLEKALK